MFSSTGWLAQSGFNNTESIKNFCSLVFYTRNMKCFELQLRYVYCTMFIICFVYTLLCRGEIGPSRSLKEFVYTGSSKMDCINDQKYCQVFIPNFHPFSLILLKCTVCLYVFFISHLYTGKC